ncbi:di-trans,poly-cis-decaprenylcistransferase [Sulfuricurvum sp.]|uniref:di-trans,poly-cis-decaprenylcistransferase n=1 Tax=Sulfuricurvum sp. TaxID=2025608 RepID=UPI0026111B75|nr:di-trans,poly-cis-decaprenylcistransferase [Sulfuricurvum sp.]MDD2266327.1 di-trans,poly-cis-decaprenylcistransferase [Sulfuricurvum sp.]MDD2784562.1 di-trans,poly-cis-decaprenylcistransferase [Sulfuricurvum sp.]
MSNQPRHVAIIMDGNGRWAEMKGKTRTFGHEQGAETVRAITTYCAKHSEIERLTLYAFSTENWKRPKIEVEFLMKLLERYLKSERSTYLEGNIRFEPIGDLSIFSKSLRNVIDDVQNATSECNGLVQNLALNYGSRDEIVRAANSLRNTEIITVESLSAALDCTHDVDLLIRTGGDHRLSNFLLWQAAYAELFFTNTLWPDFAPNELEAIIKKFKTVERRFGGLA